MKSKLLAVTKLRAVLLLPPPSPGLFLCLPSILLPNAPASLPSNPGLPSSLSAPTLLAFPLLPLLPYLSSLLYILGANHPTVHHVLKGARDVRAGIIGEISCSVCQDPSDLSAWRHFFMLARCIQANPARGRLSRLNFGALSRIASKHVKAKCLHGRTISNLVVPLAASSSKF